MRRTLSLILLLTSVTLALATIWFPPPRAAGARPTDAATAARIVSQRTENGFEPVAEAPAEIFHDAGTVIDEDHPTLKVAVPFANSTNRTLRLRQVSRSCSCTEAELRLTHLRAGESTTLDLSFRTFGKSGPQRITVDYVDAEGAAWRFGIHVLVLTRARFARFPDEAILPTAAPGKVVSKEVTLELFGRDKKSLPAFVAATASRNCTVSAASPSDTRVTDEIVVRRIPLTLAIQAPRHSGPFRVELIAQYDVGRERRSTALSLNGSVPSVFEVTPPFVYFGTSSAMPNENRKQIKISRANGEPFSVLSLNVEGTDAVSAKISDLKDSASAVIDLALDREALSIPISGQIVIQTSNREQPYIRVPFGASPEPKR